MKLLSLLLSTLLCASCAWTSKVEPWPDLDETVIRLRDDQVFAKCYEAIPLWQRVLLLAVPVGCSEISFQGHWCHIFVGTTSPESVIEHERRHCRGERHL